MNYLKLTIIVLLILTTLAICIINPKMHKKVFIGNFNPVVVQEQSQGQQSETINSEIVNREHTPHEVFKKQRQIIENKNPETKPSDVKPQEKVVKTEKKPPLLKVVNPKPISLQQPTTSGPKKLTPEEEEIIAWNTWRSNLQNKVMRDTKISAPIGTRFRFSFTVDKFGNISNLKVWSENSDYTPTAVRIVKPTILGYQGQNILNFPPKSKRVITNVNGGFTIWYNAGYSSPSDYSDYERVR